MSSGRDRIIEYYKNLPEEEREKIVGEFKKSVEEMSNKVKESITITLPKSLKELGQSLEEFYKRYEENKDLLDKIQDPEELKRITGMSIDEIDELSINELLELVIEKLKNPFLTIPATNYPKKFVIPKDKVSNKLFNNELAAGSHLVATESRKSKKELTAKVSIDFNELEGVAISKDITPYDREVHDAIVSLYVDGANEYITPLMIYRTMTGNPKAKLTPKQQKAISESVTKCSMARIRIDTKEEADAFNMDKLIYEGNLLYTKIVEGTHKGETSEWIYIMERPILYDYANDKGQIARAEISLLNTPISKNEETIILQGYLLKRILTMQNSKMSRNILFETVYKQLDVKAASKASLDNKHKKIRDAAKRILDDWKEKDFIKGYKENRGAKNVRVGLTILVD